MQHIHPLFGRQRRAAPLESASLLPHSQPSGQPRAPASNNDIQWHEAFHYVFPYAIPPTWPLRLVALFTMLCVISSRICVVVRPYAYKLAVDALSANLVQDRKTAEISVPYMAVALWVGTRLIGKLLRACQDYSYSVVATACAKKFSVDLFSHLQKLSLAWHLQRGTGEVIRIMDRGISSIDTLVDTVFITLLSTSVEALLVIGIFLRLGTPAIALTTVLTVVLYSGFTAIVTQWRTKYQRDYIDADNAVSAQAVDALINYETVKMFGMENEESTAYHVLQTKYQEEFLRYRLTLSSLKFGQGIFRTSGFGMIMLLSAVAAARKQITPGDFVAINAYVAHLFQPLFEMGSTYINIARAATDLEKCIALLRTEVTVKDKPGATNLSTKQTGVHAGQGHRVEFRNVSFKYGNSTRGDSGGVKDISFVVEPGKTVALVGASGVGKSTIVRLLLRFYDVDNGSVVIDGRDVREYTQTSLRREIGVVAQDTALFNKSLRFNISYGKQDASDAEIYSAARSAALESLIAKLPDKLDTAVGERGVCLSGGERQLVGHARCIIKAPGILLLDEASSALDTKTEREIQANLHGKCNNRTTIIIAHRLSTITMADEIIVLGTDEKHKTLGKIIERGTHHSLINRCGVYAKMWAAQCESGREK